MNEILSNYYANDKQYGVYDFETSVYSVDIYTKTNENVDENENDNNNGDIVPQTFVDLEFYVDCLPKNGSNDQILLGRNEIGCKKILNLSPLTWERHL